MFFSVACNLQDDGESSPTFYTVTFVQDGQADQIKTVQKGENVELPVITVTPPVGYSYEWERTDFFDLSRDIIVRLKVVPNKYTVYYDIGEDLYAKIESKTQTVTYGEELVLLLPTRFGYTFDGWVFADTNEPFSLEKYTVAGDAHLIAKWSLDKESDRWFTPDL